MSFVLVVGGWWVLGVPDSSTAKKGSIWRIQRDSFQDLRGIHARMCIYFQKVQKRCAVNNGFYVARQTAGGPTREFHTPADLANRLVVDILRFKKVAIGRFRYNQSERRYVGVGSIGVDDPNTHYFSTHTHSSHHYYRLLPPLTYI